MYVRGWVEGAGRQVSVSGPGPKRRDVCQTVDVPPLPARTMFVATTSIATRAGRVRRKWTTALSRNPSPFGLAVVSSGRSPVRRASRPKPQPCTIAATIPMIMNSQPSSFSRQPKA